MFTIPHRQLRWIYHLQTPRWDRATSKMESLSNEESGWHWRSEAWGGGGVEQKLRLAVIPRSTCWEAPSNLLSITLTAVTLGGVLSKCGCRETAVSPSGEQPRCERSNPAGSLTPLWQSVTDVKALKLEKFPLQLWESWRPTVTLQNWGSWLHLSRAASTSSQTEIETPAIVVWRLLLCTLLIYAAMFSPRIKS